MLIYVYGKRTRQRNINIKRKPQLRASKNTEKEALSKELLTGAGIELVSDDIGKERAEELIKDSIEWATACIDNGEKDTISFYMDKTNSGSAIKNLLEICENNFGKPIDSGVFRTVFGAGDKVIKVPHHQVATAMFADHFATPADDFCSQYVEKYTADNFTSENDIRVAETELFHTSEGIPIIVMEKVKIPERTPFDAGKVTKRRHSHLFGNKPGQISNSENMTLAERMTQVGVNKNKELVIFDAGDWWKDEEKEFEDDWVYADFTKEFIVDLYKACPKSIAD